MEAFLGTILMFAGNYAPRGWMFCEGQELAIQQHQALFALIGTTYGGDGKRTFKLPDLRGRFPLQPNLSDPNMPRVTAGQTGGSVINQVFNVPVQKATDPTKAETTTQVATTVAPQGNAVNNMPPYVGINYIICVDGTWPDRD